MVPLRYLLTSNLFCVIQIKNNAGSFHQLFTMRTGGIIGGLGPPSTAKFYLEIISRCYEKTKKQRPPLLIWNVPLKYQIEKELIRKSTGEEKYIPYLIESAKMLEKAGADFLVIPCNTVHIFIEEIRKTVNIPALSIVEETINFLKEKNISLVGILSTTKTLQQNLYGRELEKYNIKINSPEKDEQVCIEKIIYNILRNKDNKKDHNKLLKIINNFKKKGIKDILLACTDLQLLLEQKEINVAIYDSMRILTDATVKEILRD